MPNRRTAKDKHHIIPKHDGGTDDPDNITPPISKRMHAMFHYDRWKALGQYKDFLAWRMLMGQITVSEAATAAWYAGCKKGGRIGGKIAAKSLDPYRRMPKTEQHKARIAAALTGHRHTETTKQKMSLMRKGAQTPLQAKANQSPERKAKLSAAAKLQWQRWREARCVRH